MTQQLNGSRSIAITRLSRISQSRVTAWRGQTEDGRQVHLSYLFGWLTIELREAVPGTVNGGSWRTIVRIDTGVLEAESESRGARSNGGAGSPIKADVSRRLGEGRAAQTAEMRRSLNGQDRRTSRRVTFAQLQRWIEMLGTFGSSPVELSAWFETDSPRTRGELVFAGGATI